MARSGEARSITIYILVETTDQQEVMVLGLGAQVLEDRLFPVTFHVIPIINHAMTNGVVYAIAGRLGVC